ncbi:MAG: hypothetical protein ABSG57_06065 [Candidatus Bathyarchaeia archaeon]
MNNRGQFSIIAALLISIILVSTVMLTYTVILNDSIQVQPQVLTAIDETNFAIKQLLSFSVGYYGSVIRVTGDASFANQSTLKYTTSGLEYVANTHPDWGAGFSLTNLTVDTYWFNNTSFSTGYLSVTYNLTKLGIYGVQYAPSCGLTVQITNTTQNNQTSLIVTEDQNEPVTDLEQHNFQFFQYQTANSTWKLVSSSTSPIAYANGTYQIQPPVGIDPNSYVVQVEDQRGIIVVASPFSSYVMNLTWPSVTSNATSPSYYYVNNDVSDVDSNGDIGTHLNFTAQQYGPDNINDTLIETDVPTIQGDTQQFVQGNTSDVDGNGNTGTASNFTTEKYSEGIFDTLTEADTNSSSPEKYSYFSNNGGVWTSPASAYDNNTGTAATYSWSASGYGAYLTLNLTYVTRGSKIQYWVARSNSAIDTMDIDIANQTGSWLNVYSGTFTRNAYANASIAFSQYTAVRFRFSKTDTSSRTVSIFEAQGVNDSVYANYRIDLERQWTSAPYNTNGSELLCIKTGTFSNENLEVDVWNGVSWTVLNSNLAANAWNNMSVSSYLTSATFTIRFVDTVTTGDTVQSTWQIDSVLLHTWNSTDNYRLDAEEQWTNVNYLDPHQKFLSIKTGALDAETISVDGWSGSGWVSILSNLAANSWNNASVSSLVQSSTFTIRFRDGNINSDPTQNSWRIDATLLTFNGTIQSMPTTDTLTIELLQNGTMRWLGQSLQLTSQAMPIPPLPVKSIHVNQTINGVDSEVPFQIEDWASNYLVPLGLTGNSSVFSDGNMIVFLANNNVSRVTIWWNGSDLATQTPYAFVNRYFTGDNPSTGTLTNSMLTLQFGGSFTLTSTVGSSSCTATFMRLNGQASTYGASPAYVIASGVVRDIVQQEAEWSNGAPNSPNLYAHIVITLPANATYYTYQLRVMFVQSQQSRTVTELCPIELQGLFTQAQTENGTAGGYPIVSTATGTFYNQSAIWAHHWSQLISGANGAGITFTDVGNNELYSFDSLAGTQTGGLRVNAAAGTIELHPVEMAPASFTYTLNTIWMGAVSTFSNTTPIYQIASGQVSGSWLSVEYPPTAAVFTGH